MEKLMTLIKNPTNKSIKFDRVKRAFVYTDAGGTKVTFKGLKPALESVFWPNYQYVPSQYRRGGTGVSSPMEGINRGQYVHEQLCDYFNMTTANFLKKHKTLHPYTKKAIFAMKRWELKPCRAEFTVYDTECRVATRLDALMIDKYGEFALVDWKCGMDDYIMKGNGMIRGPLSQKLSNCPLHQGYFQVLMTKKFLEKNYNFKIRNVYIVQITQDGVMSHPIPAELVQDIDTLYSHFCLELSKARQNKSAALKRKMWAARKNRGRPNQQRRRRRFNS